MWNVPLIIIHALNILVADKSALYLYLFISLALFLSLSLSLGELISTRHNPKTTFECGGVFETKYTFQYFKHTFPVSIGTTTMRRMFAIQFYNLAENLLWIPHSSMISYDPISWVVYSSCWIVFAHPWTHTHVMYCKVIRRLDCEFIEVMIKNVPQFAFFLRLFVNKPRISPWGMQYFLTKKENEVTSRSKISCHFQTKVELIFIW